MKPTTTDGIRRLSLEAPLTLALLLLHMDALPLASSAQAPDPPSRLLGPLTAFIHPRSLQAVRLVPELEVIVIVLQMAGWFDVCPGPSLRT